MGKTVAIVQSSYLPWKGYFDLIRSADVFVLYDDVQYTKRDWRNRNVIKTPQGLHWLSIPVKVKGRYHQAIDEVEVADSQWVARHWQTIEMAYRRAPRFIEHAPALRSMLLACASMQRLSEINRHLIQSIAALLGIQTPILDCRPFGRVPGRTENLQHLCSALGATVYLSGPAAKSYLDESVFTQAGIEVRYMDYSGYPEYPQLYPPFEHHVSIVDLLLNTGHDAPRYLQRAPAT